MPPSSKRSRSVFRTALEDVRPKREGTRRWLFVPYDQLSDEIGPLSSEPPGELGVVLVESAWKAARRPVHQLKLAWVLSNQRHFALEQAERGVAVRYLAGDASYADALRSVRAELGPLRVARPAERELREHLAPLFEEGTLEEIPHEGWLSTREDFVAGAGQEPPWRMDAFYRRLRKRSGVLMEDGKPLGGKFSHDADNRQAWSGDPPAPDAPRFDPDELTLEVARLVRERFADHPGELTEENLSALSASRADAERLWAWAKEECLPLFGPHEDAFSERSRGLFHTRISPLLNLHRLTPRRIVEEALELDLPLSSVEGFVRQILGWREFVHHVHEETDGLRELEEVPEQANEPARDGGYERWRGESFPSSLEESRPAGRDAAGSRASFLGSEAPLPRAFWGTPSGLRCLDETVRAVWEDGWSHHIERLMVLANLGTLLDVSPRELTDWFWVAYVDAYDWVVEPNVLGMGTFGCGPLMTTKPYVSGAAYLDRMGDHCGSCAFSPKKDCPITPLYWAFLARHEERLAGVDRMRLPLASMRKRAAEKKTADEAVFAYASETLAAGEALEPARVRERLLPASRSKPKKTKAKKR